MKWRWGLSKRIRGLRRGGERELLTNEWHASKNLFNSSLQKSFNSSHMGQQQLLGAIIGEQNGTHTTREQTLERCPNLALASAFFCPQD